VDLSCIISSGDLELYVLGLLPEEDAYKVEQLSLLFPEIRQELDRISQSLENLATTATVAPSPDVKVRLMQQLSALKAAENNTATATEAPVHNIKEVHTTPVIPVKAKRENKGFLMAASIGALLLSIIAVIYLARQNQQQNQQVAALQKQVNNLGQQTSIQQQQLQAATQTLQLWQDEDVRKIALTSVPGKPAALAQVFWNPKTSEVYIEDVSLPPAPAGKQYQLWAIVDGKPVDAGMLSKAANEVQKMKTFAAADAFAITLEKEGGSTTPTMEEMYVMAKAS
jgi:anti-sigma-K factor RskA